MLRYLRCICGLFCHDDNLALKQSLLAHNMSRGVYSQLTAEDITNKVINIFNQELAQEIAELFAYSAVSDNSTMRERIMDFDRMRSEAVHERARSHTGIAAVEEEFSIMYKALGQHRHSNIQLCISRQLQAELPDNIIVHPKIESTRRAEEVSVVNFIIENASLIKDDAKDGSIPLNLQCRIVITKESILLQLISVTKHEVLVSIQEPIHNSRRERLSSDARSVYF
jgi:hypothetical protein